MHRQVVFLMFAGFVSLSSASLAAAPSVADDAPSAATVAVQRINLPETGLRDEAAMVLVGTALIGLAAAVRRAA